MLSFCGQDGPLVNVIALRLSSSLANVPVSRMGLRATVMRTVRSGGFGVFYMDCRQQPGAHIATQPY